MYKDILQGIDHIAVWPIISFSIFFIFFICLLWWVFSADKTYIRKMKGLPFEDESEPTGGWPWRKVLVLFLFLMPGSELMAQETSDQSFWIDPFNNPMMPLYVTTTLVFVTLVLVMVVAVYMLKVLNMFVHQAEKERAEKLGMTYVPSVSWWTKFWDQFNASVPLEQEMDIDLGHEFDGIRELDNHLPPWWKGLFYGSMVWAVIYMAIYHFMGSMPLSGAEYENDVALAAEQLRAYRASQPVTVIDENTLTYTKEEAFITNGKKVFMSNNCGSCHRNDGGGNAIGPNLTDMFWIHGGDIRTIFTTIKSGVVEKGMPAWGKVMSPSDVRDVTFFVMSLQGSKPDGAKAPQGKEYVPPVEETADSTKRVGDQ